MQSVRSASEVFFVFLRLGCMAFGGPVAHLGYFQKAFVEQRQWLKETEYADLVALCQFLPGPASSQVGFAIGLKRAGVWGAFAAWLGFTLPSAILMISFAYGLLAAGVVERSGWISGLKLAAVAVVADAIWSMAAKLCPDRARAIIALSAAAFLLLASNAIWQIAVILAGAAAGFLLFRKEANVAPSPQLAARSRRGWPFLALFFALLLVMPFVASQSESETIALSDGFYRAGSLVFGGGHVVLPLLESFTVDRGWISSDAFLAGYGTAQAMPGPLFSFSSFLGASISVGPGGAAGGVLALIATYLPSWLLIFGILPYWEKLSQLKAARAALLGTNAAVVGLLLSAFYDPIWTSAISSPSRLAFALVAFAALRFAKLPPWALVLACALAGWILL